MKKRIISLLLVFVMILGILPTASFAASSEEEALGEVDIFNGNRAMSYLSINGSVKTMEYTYYNFKTAAGYVRETPAYCVNPTLYGVPQTVGPGESIKYIANEKASDPKVVGIICNGYPHYSLEALHLDDKYQAYYATKVALWCYLLPSWNINNLKVAPGQSAADQEIAQRVLAAAKTIYQRGTTYNYMKEPKLTATPDKSVAYPVTVDGKQYKQQVFTLRSETFVYNLKIAVAFADPGSVPAGTRIVDMGNQDITDVITDGSVGSFKVLYPVDSIKGETGSVQLSLSCSVAKYAVMYAICAEKDKYGNLQNYICDVDNNKRMELAAVSNYYDTPDEEIPDETALRIIKLEEGTEMPLEGAVFSVYDPAGKKLGSYSTGPDGRVTIPLTLEGHYTVTEEIPPKYHLLPNITTQHADVEYNKIAELTFWNAPYGSLWVQKMSNTGDPLNGVTVQIKHIETGEVITGKTLIGGVVVFDNLKPGGYEVKEVAGISGWIADTDTVQTVSVVAGKSSDVTITNKELPGLRIIKYDRKKGELLPGVTFVVFRDAISLGHFKTDAMGEILITDALPGTYRAFEVDTGNEGLILDMTPQEIELRAGDGIRELLFYNDTKPGMRLVKVDSTDPSKPIPNAVFEIKSVAGDYGPEEFTTNKDGEIDLSMLPPGAYVVTEKSCAGYVVDDAQRIIQLDPNEDAEFVFTNSKLPDLQLLKTSSDGTPLAGVSFRLAKIEDGSHYLDRTTDSKGEILWENLEPGVYSLKEIATVSDHILDTREYHVELFPGKISTITLENQKRPNLTVYKSDFDTDEPIPNTVFLVKAADGHSVNEIKTDATGKATLENLLPGVYEISEKSVPSPYLLDAEPQLVTLYANVDRVVYFKNHKAPTIEIIKEDSITHNRLAGVRFQVWYGSNHTSTGELNNLGIFTTDENGRIELTGPANGLRDGWFRVKELAPLKGYSIKDSDTQEAFVQAGKSHTFRFENTPLSALVVYKYDSEHPNIAIEGAVFQVKYLGGTSGTGGTVIGTYKTGPNGSFTVTGLQAGTYVVSEIASDSNHVIDTAPQTAYISGKDQDVVQLYFGNSPKGSLLVKKVDSSNGKPLSDVEFFVTTSDGTVVGNANGKFVTDSAGTFLVEGIDPNTTLVVKETRAKNGYLLDDVPQTAQIKAGQTVSLEFRNKPLGNLVIHKLSSGDKKTPLAGVQFKITYADGKVVDAEGGKLSSSGLYWTNSEGQIILSGIMGTVIVTEVASIDGYTIDPKTQSQTVVVNPDDTQHLYFYNDPIGGVEIVKVVEGNEDKRIPNVTFEIRKMNDALVDTVTTDKNGRVFVTLEAGSYYAVETKCPKEYKLDSTPHYFEVVTGKTTPQLVVTNKAFSGIILHKIDSVTGDGIYDVKFLVYDQNKNPIGEYSTDQDGYIYIDDVTVQGKGKLYIRELEAAPGYELDKQYKTVYVQPGKTIEVEWKNTPITGQFQIYKYAAEYNEVTGTPAGAPLQGAVYEISEARSGKVVDYLTTDARGVAASKPLPLGRYKITEVTAPAYWQLSGKIFDETLEYSGQIIKVSDYDKPSNLGVSITKRGNSEALAGSQMRYDFTVANTSNVALESFYWHERIPTDATRATVLTTGTYSARLNYRILYKTNYTTGYQVLASNLLTSNSYSFSLNAIPTQAGEYVTDVYFDFGKVPVGFQSTSSPTLTVQILGTVANGYQIVNRADVGGKYQGTWQTAQASWVTIVRKLTPTIIPTLPKTGY